MLAGMRSALGWPFAAALLIGCAGGGGPRDAAAPSPVTAGFLAEAPDVVEVRVTDRQPVDKVELYSPDGRVYLAHRIDREKVAAEQGPYTGLGVGVGMSGGSQTRVGTSIGLGFPLGGMERPPYESQYYSVALVRVDDMAGYQAGWRRWVVRIRLGTPETSFRFMEFPAPRPPEG